MLQDGSKAWAARGILTDAGHLLLRYTERLLALSADAVTATRDVQDVRTGSIYLAASQTTGVYLLPKMIGGVVCEALLLLFLQYVHDGQAGKQGRYPSDITSHLKGVSEMVRVAATCA